MKVLMIGTPFCSVCKRMSGVLAEYCEKHKIAFNYQMLSSITDKNILNILSEKKVTKAPVFLIYKGEEIILATGDNIFLELESIDKKENNFE